MLIANQTELLVNSGALLALFQEMKMEELKLLYTLYSPIGDGLKLIADKFKIHVIEMGRTCVERCSQVGEGVELSVKELLTNGSLIENLVTLQSNIGRMAKYCFQGDSLFGRQVQLGFQAFMNLDVGQVSMAELLAGHIDKLLRRGGTKSAETSVEELLEQQVALFAYLVDKDLFLEVYRN